MFKVKSFLFCIYLLAFSGIACQGGINCKEQGAIEDFSQDDSSNSDNQDIDLDFIDELMEAPKNPDAKPSNFKIPNFIREYGMRSLEFMFYLQDSANYRYQGLIRNLKTIYYRV